jgi:hypothetical protein
MDADTQHRIATACGNAMMCYSEAWMAAWTAAATTAAGQIAELTTPAAERRPTSWFNAAPNGTPFYADADQNLAMWSTFSGLPVQTWLTMMPLRGEPSSWPFAYWLIAAGLPKDVAWPTAQGNAAVLEASSLAATEIQRVFATYRTDGEPDASVTSDAVAVNEG